MVRRLKASVEAQLAQKYVPTSFSRHPEPPKGSKKVDPLMAGSYKVRLVV